MSASSLLAHNPKSQLWLHLTASRNSHTYGIFPERSAHCPAQASDLPTEDWPLAAESECQDIPSITFKAGEYPFAVFALRRSGQRRAAMFAAEQLVLHTRVYLMAKENWLRIIDQSRGVFRAARYVRNPVRRKSSACHKSVWW